MDNFVLPILLLYGVSLLLLPKEEYVFSLRQKLSCLLLFCLSHRRIIACLGFTSGFAFTPVSGSAHGFALSLI